MEWWSDGKQEIEGEDEEDEDERGTTCNFRLLT